MFWLKLIGIFLFGSGLSQIAASFQRRKAGAAPAFVPPTVASGKPIPVLYGTWRVPVIPTWVGDVKTKKVYAYDYPRLLGFIHFAGPQLQAIAYEYSVTMQGVLCWGKTGAPNNIIFGGSKLLSDQPATHTVKDDPTGDGFIVVPTQSGDWFAIEALNSGRKTVTYFLPDVNGGPTRGGGFKGAVTFAIGSLQYGPDPLMQSLINAGEPTNSVPSYSDVATVVYDDVTVGESPTPPAVEFVLTRFPDMVIPGLLATSYNAFREIGPVGKQWLVQELTHVVMLYDALRSQRYGGGEPQWKFKSSSWAAAAAQLYADGIFGSMLVGAGGQQSTLQAIVDEFERVADGALVRDPETFQWAIKLFRNEAATVDAFNALPLVDEGVLRQLEWHRTDPSETINQVMVEFSNADKLWETDTVTLTDEANVAMTGSIRASRIQYSSVTDRRIAIKLCARDLRRASTPLGRGKAFATRALWSAERGDCVRLSDTKQGLDRLVARVTSVDFGEPGDEEIAVEFVEDVFGHDDIVYSGAETSPIATAPTVSRPIVNALTQSIAGNVGTLAMSVLDPERRITEIAFKHQSGSGPVSDWVVVASATPDATDPTFPYNDHVTNADLNGSYTHAVAISSAGTSAIAYRITYVASGTVALPLSGLETIEGEVSFSALRRTAVPGLSFIYSGSDVIVTASAPDASSVKIAGSLAGTPTAADVRATSAIVSSPFTKTLTAPAAGQVLTIDALAYEGTTESALSPPLVIAGGAPSGTPGTEALVFPDGLGGFELVFDADGNQLFL